MADWKQSKPTLPERSGIPSGSTTLPIMSGTLVTQNSSPDATFAKVLASYHSKYAEAGPSSAQLDSPIRYDVVLDEEDGMISALMGSLEET